ncbi:hypothetical protein [Methylobacterium sp. CM6257]
MLDAFTAAELADCAECEVRQQQRTDPRWVEYGRMTQQLADRQTALMQAQREDQRQGREGGSVRRRCEGAAVNAALAYRAWMRASASRLIRHDDCENDRGLTLWTLKRVCTQATAAICSAVAVITKLANDASVSADAIGTSSDTVATTCRTDMAGLPGCDHVIRYGYCFSAGASVRAVTHRDPCSSL